MAKAVARKKRAQSKSNNTTWIVGAVVGAVILVLAIVLINLNTGQTRTAPPTSVSTGRTLGQDTAPVTVEIYADFQCPYCARADVTLMQLAPKWVDTGKVKYVYHHFAFIGDESTWASQAAECANDQGKFWDYATYLYDHQQGENRGAFSKDNLKRFAASLNLETAKFNACLDSSEHLDTINSETAQGRARGVRSTPSFFINNQFVEGALSADQFAAVFDSYQPKP